MAEVFLAMQEGIGGFEKLVVVKRIFPHFCEDAQFVKMFFDEARLAASIRHPNVVEIYDVIRDAHRAAEPTVQPHGVHLAWHRRCRGARGWHLRPGGDQRRQ